MSQSDRRVSPSNPERAMLMTDTLTVAEKLKDAGFSEAKPPP